MAQKGRNDITTGINTNVYDNNNKEILAQMVRSILGDIRDSYFNLIDDELANLKYDSNLTLAQKLANTANLPPLWGSTDYFDPGSNNGNITSYGDNGIVQSMNYLSLGGPDCEITINLSKSVANRKLAINLFTNETNMNANNDFCAPITRIVDSQTLKIAMRELAGAVNRVRIEIMAYTVDKGN